MADQISANQTSGAEQGQGTVEERMQRALFGNERPAKQAQEPEPEPAAPPAAEKQAEPSEGEAPTDELTPDDIDTDAEQATGEEQPAIEDAFEIVHNGKQHKLSREETIKLAQQGFDYTQKTQAVAAQQKQVQEALNLVQQVSQMQLALADDLAQVKAFERALQPYQNVDWIALATNEPLEYPKHQAQYDQLMKGYNAALYGYKTKGEKLIADQQKAARMVLDEEAKKLGDLLPRWQKPEVFQQDARAISEYGIKEGYTKEELEGITDARYVRTLWKAKEYDRLLAAKEGKVKLMQKAAPMAKPGSSTGTPTAADKEKELRARLRKTGSDDALAAILLNRMK